VNSVLDVANTIFYFANRLFDSTRVHVFVFGFDAWQAQPGGGDVDFKRFRIPFDPVEQHGDSVRRCLQQLLRDDAAAKDPLQKERSGVSQCYKLFNYLSSRL
jgi:hypothetical protein